MNVNELKVSKFLKQADVGRGVLVTIESLSQQDVAQEGAEPNVRWVIHFAECEKPLVLNSTNGQLIAKITGSEESDNWIGHKIVLYADPNVSFGGKLVGGIRVRAPKPGVVKSQPKPVETPPPEDGGMTDDLPF